MALSDGTKVVGPACPAQTVTDPAAVPRLEGTCYNTVAPGYGFSLSGTYQPKDDIFAEIEGSGFTSPVDAPREIRKQEADIAQSWYHTITAETFG